MSYIDKPPPQPEDYCAPGRCLQWADVDISGKLGWLTLAQSRNFVTFHNLQDAISELPNDADTKICFYAGRLREAAQTYTSYRGPLKLEPLHQTLVIKVLKAAGAHNGPNLPIRLDKALYILYGINCVRAESGQEQIGRGTIRICAFYLRGLSESRKSLLDQVRTGSREASNEAREQLIFLQEFISKGLNISERFCEEIVKGCATSIDLAIRLHECLANSGAAKRVPKNIEDALVSCMDTARPMAKLEIFGPPVESFKIPAPYKRFGEMS